MYPYGSLPANLVAFCGVLRNEHGFRVGPAEQHDAARALEIIDLEEESSVRDALRPILSRTAAEARTFDAVFTAFFFPAPAGVPQPDLPLMVRGLAPDVVAGRSEHCLPAAARRTSVVIRWSESRLVRLRT